MALPDGVRRFTFRLPLGIDHVHCYALRGDDGRWTLVDAGLGLPDARARWAAALATLDAPVARIVITHFHPDHVGAAAELAALTGAPVFQGSVDREQSRQVWREPRAAQRGSEHMRANGMPTEEVEALRAASVALAAWVHPPADPVPLEPGDEVDGWTVMHLPGHADGHLALHRRGVLVAGDAILGEITPNIGLWPECRPDPLADYARSLERIIELAPHVALPGHGPPIDDPRARARALIEHHRDRLVETEDALDARPRSGYEISLALFPGDLAPPLRRFALAEALAHLERLVREARAVRLEAGGRPLYTAA